MDKEKLIYILPGIITILIFITILILKGIYPFGALKIDYYDNMQQVAPIYNHLWDWLHGQESLFFDWYTGMGTNLSMTVSAFSMLSPFNLLLYIIPRKSIHDFFYIFILIKLVFISETMYIYLNKKFSNAPYLFKLLFSLMFTFSGYQMLYSTTFMPWMDVIVFFPLLMLALDNIFKGKSSIYYILILTLCWIINYYITALILFFILIVSGLYITTFVEKEDRKKCICDLGIGTIISIGLAAFVLVPTFTMLMNSQRINKDNYTFIEQIVNIFNAVPNRGYLRIEQYLMFAELTLPIVIIFRGMFKYKEEKNVVKIVSILLVIMIIPFVIETTNLLLHFGSYVSYNMRYGFIINFVFLAIACYYSSKIQLPEEKIRWYKILIYFLLFVSIYGLSILLYGIIIKKLYTYEYNVALNRYVALFIIMFLVFLAAYYIILKKNNSIKKSLLFFMAMLELSLFAYICLGRPTWLKYDPFQEGEYVEYANEAKEQLNIEEDKLNRITNPDLSLNANYPLILRRASLSSYTAAIPDGIQNNCVRWGYSRNYVFLLNSGGTIFSDALLNTKQAISVTELNEDLYKLREQTENYYLYDSKYTLPFAMTVSNRILETDIDNLNWIELNNSMYKLLTGTDDELVEPILKDEKVSKKIKNVAYNKKGNKLSFDINIKDASVLYFCSGQGSIIRINGDKIEIPSVGETDLVVYPNSFNNNVVELGSFEDETVKVEVETSNNNKFNIQMCLGILNLEKMKKLCEEYKDYSAQECINKNSITLSVTGAEDKNVVLLPIAYDEGWKVKINGIETEKVSNVLGMFTAIELEKGENKITMTFIPKGLKIGIIISAISILICFILMKNKGSYKCLENIAKYTFYLVYWSAMNIVYIFPVIYYIWMKLTKIA